MYEDSRVDVRNDVHQLVGRGPKGVGKARLAQHEQAKERVLDGKEDGRASAIWASNNNSILYIWVLVGNSSRRKRLRLC